MALVLTKKYVIAIGVVASIAIAGLGANYVVMPTLASVNEAQTNITDAEESKASMEARLAGLQAAEEQYPQIEAINSSLTGQFPESGQTQQLIEQIFKAATDNGMTRDQVASISFDAPTIETPEVAAPVAPAEGEAAPAEGGDAVADPAAAPAATTAVPEGFAKLNLSISVSGTQEQVSKFLDSLNKMDRVITVRELSINPDGEGDNVTLAFSATAYVYRAIPAPGTLNTPEELAEEETVEVAP